MPTNPSIHKFDDELIPSGLVRLLAALLLLAAALPARAGTVTQVRDSGPDSNRLVMVLLAEGYTAAEEARFDADAANVLAILLAESPWLEYANYLNVYTDFVASAESGADKPQPCWGNETFVNTAFDATFCAFGVRRLLVADTGKVLDEVSVAVPQFDLVGVIVNDAEYGGSGGQILVFSTEVRAPEVFLHETGHTFARLADEYETPVPGHTKIAPEPNVTMETEFDQIKWNPWIEAGTPLPTPETNPWRDVVGLFEGARYFPTEIFRPRLDCKMRSLGVPFGEVCKEAHIQALYRWLSPIDAWSPPLGTIPFDSCTQLHFEVVPQLPVPQTIATEWQLDGTPLPGETETTLTLDGADLPGDSYTVDGVMIDETPLVRRLYWSPMRDIRRWNLSRTSPPSDLDGDGVDDACDDDIDGDTALNGDDCWPRDPSRISEPVPEAAGLRVEHNALLETWLSWTDVLGPRGTPDEGFYALTSGLIADLGRDGDFSGACGMSGAREPLYQDVRSGPGSSQGWYYLVQGLNGCGPGEIGSSSPPPPDLRSGLDWAALPACP